MSAKTPNLTLFDPYVGGHHPEYLAHLIRFWPEERGYLEIATPEGNLQHLDILVDLKRGKPAPSVGWHPLPPIETTSLLRAAWENRRLLKAYLPAAQPEHILLMYADHAQLPLTLDLRFDFPLRISGIFFRFSFHYPREKKHSAKDFIRSWRKQFLLQCTLKHPHLHTLFTLDPYCADILQEAYPRVNVAGMPDPLAPSGKIPEEPVIPHHPHRRVALMFGAHTARKGILQVLEACLQLSSDVARSLHLVLAGKVPVELENEVHSMLDRIRVRAPDLEITLKDTFIPYEESGTFFRSADLVLIPYQRNVGMSGILVRAAAAGKPVIGQQYGLLGRLISDYQLGEAVDTTRPSVLAQALSNWIREEAISFAPRRAKQFAELHTPERYASTIYSNLF